jgi:hypothetical protein
MDACASARKLGKAGRLKPATEAAVHGSYKQQGWGGFQAAFFARLRTSLRDSVEARDLERTFHQNYTPKVGRGW